MEFTIDRSLFLEGLEKTLSVVEKRNTMPSLNHALIDVKEDQLQISATDLEIFVSASVPCKVVNAGRIALPARNLYDIVKESQSNEIKIRGLENNRAEIKSGKSLFKILGLSADDFPHFKTSPKGQLSTGRLKVQEFLRLIQKTEHCICHEEYRYALTGIYLESVTDSVDNKGKTVLRAVATDGHRLSLMECPIEQLGNVKLTKGMIIPRKGAVELRKLLESTNEEEFELTCDENLIRVNLGRFKIWIRPLDAEYPDYRRVLPGELPNKFFCRKGELASALKRMSLLVSDRSRVVAFNFQKERLELSTQNPELGEATDEISGDYTGGAVKAGFNVRFFAEALTNFSDEKLIVHTGEALQPALLKAPGDEGLTIVIMPMRL
jgi:DNA polymerase-3 subunit beta